MSAQAQRAAENEYEKLEKDVAELRQAQTTAVREKYWSELSIEQKIERTREQVKRCLALIEELSDRSIVELRACEALRHDLVNHRHQIDHGGTVMFPASTEKTKWFEQYDRGAIGRGRTPKLTPDSNPAEVYF